MRLESRCILVSALPSHGRLQMLRALGLRVLVNCSGADSIELYGSELVQGVELHDFRFPDVFTRASCIEMALKELGEDGLMQLSLASELVAEAVRNRKRVLVFCHLGVGRSPLVAAMGLEQSGILDVAGAQSWIESIRPEADFSSVSHGVWNHLRMNRESRRRGAAT